MDNEELVALDDELQEFNLNDFIDTSVRGINPVIVFIIVVLIVLVGSTRNEVLDEDTIGFS